MRGPLSRPGPDETGTSQTSLRHHPPWRSAMRHSAVAPIHTDGVALRPVGPRDATSVPPSTLTRSPPPSHRTAGLLLAPRSDAPGAAICLLSPVGRGVGRAGRIGPKPALPSPQASGPQAPPGPPDACPPATRQPRPNPLPPGYQTDRGPLHSFTHGGCAGRCVWDRRTVVRFISAILATSDQRNL